MGLNWLSWGVLRQCDRLCGWLRVTCCRAVPLIDSGPLALLLLCVSCCRVVLSWLNSVFLGCLVSVWWVGRTGVILFVTIDRKVVLKSLSPPVFMFLTCVTLLSACGWVRVTLTSAWLGKTIQVGICLVLVSLCCPVPSVDSRGVLLLLIRAWMMAVGCVPWIRLWCRTIVVLLCRIGRVVVATCSLLRCLGLGWTRLWFSTRCRTVRYLVPGAVWFILKAGNRLRLCRAIPLAMALASMLTTRFRLNYLFACSIVDSVTCIGRAVLKILGGALYRL